MKIYTRTGDKGHTGLWGGKRISKDSIRIQAYGTVDECNAVIGLATSVLPEEKAYASLKAMLRQIQNDLFVVGADLASEIDIENVTRVASENIEQLEQWIDELEESLPPLTQFILPGGTTLASYLHLARTVCRRSERWAVRLKHQEEINTAVMLYLNRLSDFLFVAARYANHLNDTPDVPWAKPE